MCEQLEEEGRTSITAMRSEGKKRAAKGQSQGPGKKRRVDIGVVESGKLQRKYRTGQMQ